MSLLDWLKQKYPQLQDGEKIEVSIEDLNQFAMEAQNENTRQDDDYEPELTLRGSLEF